MDPLLGDDMTCLGSGLLDFKKISQHPTNTLTVSESEPDMLMSIDAVNKLSLRGPIKLATVESSPVDEEAEENVTDTDSEPDDDDTIRQPLASDRKKTQDKTFSSWSVAQVIISHLQAFNIMIGYPSMQRRLPTRKCRRPFRRRMMRRFPFGPSCPSKNQQCSSTMQGSIKWSFSRKPSNRI